MVAFYPSRAKTLQKVKDILELKKKWRRGIAPQTQTPQVLQLLKHIDQWRVKRGIQSLQIMVNKSSRVSHTCQIRSGCYVETLNLTV